MRMVACVEMRYCAEVLTCGVPLINQLKAMVDGAQIKPQLFTSHLDLRPLDVEWMARRVFSLGRLGDLTSLPDWKVGRVDCDVIALSKDAPAIIVKVHATGKHQKRSY